MAPPSEDQALLLMIAVRHVIGEPHIEADSERFAPLSGRIGYPAFCEAVAACLREGFGREAVRLPEGTLQCHGIWN